MNNPVCRAHVDSEYWDSVQKFANCQVEKLEKNKHKGKWEHLSPLFAFKLMLDEASELIDAVLRGEPTDHVWKEAADVGNFALMIAETYERNNK